MFTCKHAARSVSLLSAVLMFSGCADAASPYYLDCDGKFEISGKDGKPETSPLHWAFLIDEGAREVRSRDGENGPFSSACDEGCEGITISDQFVEWTVKVTDKNMPDFESHTHTQINRRTGALAGLTWVGQNRNADLASTATWATCKRSSKPPKSR